MTGDAAPSLEELFTEEIGVGTCNCAFVRLDPKAQAFVREKVAHYRALSEERGKEMPVPWLALARTLARGGYPVSESVLRWHFQRGLHE